MNIRPAVPEDVPNVLPMVAQICAMHEEWDPAKYGFRPAPAEMYRRWLTARASDPRSVFLVAERPEQPPDPPWLVGFLIGTAESEIPIYRLSEYGFLHDLWIEPQYRNEGIARQMVMLALERFGAMGLKQVRLDTAEKNEAARNLFRSCGFRVSTIEMLAELP